MSAAAALIPVGKTPVPIHLHSNGAAARGTASKGTPTVFVVVNDPDTRRSLEQLARSQGWQPESCGSVREFLAWPRLVAPSTLILAISSADSNGLEVQRKIARECAEVPIIVISDYEHIPTAVEAMKAGAINFLVKPFGEEELVAAITEGLARSRATLDRGTEVRNLRNCYASLTPREQQVMALVASGLLNKEVGGELGISEITVKAHRGQVMQKMNAESLAQLVKMALRLRITGYATPSSIPAKPGIYQPMEVRSGLASHTGLSVDGTA